LLFAAGSLLKVNILLYPCNVVTVAAAAAAAATRYREVVETVLRFKDSKEKLIRR
jgi:hypothetical protein